MNWNSNVNVYVGEGENTDCNVFVMWSDGMVTSMGVLKKKLENGKLLVDSPVSVVFSTSNGKNTEGKDEARLNFEIIPYLFGALLTSGSNTWEIDARHLLQNNNISEALVNAYKRTVEVTNSVKKDKESKIEVTTTTDNQ